MRSILPSSARIDGPAPARVRSPAARASFLVAGWTRRATFERRRGEPARERQAATVPRGLAQGRLSRPRGADPRVLARPAHLREEPRAAPRGPAVRLLRGPADGQRPPRRPPRALPGLQGHLPPLQDHARLPRAAQSRLGLPRPAGRARGRASPGHRRQGADRGVRRRPLQRPLPRERADLPQGLGPDDRAHRLLDRPGRRLLHAHQRLHRVGVVDPAADLGPRAALRGLQGRALLPALRHRHLEPRDGPGLPRRHRAVGLRALRADRRRRPPRVAGPRGGGRRRGRGRAVRRRGARRRPPASGSGEPGRLDDHALDARLQRRLRREPRDRLRPGREPRRALRAGP